MIGCAEHKPLVALVCGYERGGTTLLSEILRQHPELDSGFECGFLLVEKISDFPLLEPYSTIVKRSWKLTDNSLNQICQADSCFDVYKRLVKRSSILETKSGWMFDKTPKYMQVLSSVLGKVPGIPCIVIVRDPRAVLWSWAKRAKLTRKKWIENRLERSCERYLSYARGYKKAMMDGFNRQILLVRYEELCINPVTEAEKFFNFLGLDFDQSYLSFDAGTRFYNVRGDGISAQYLSDYKNNFSEYTCQKIMDLTEEAKEWFWHD